MSSLDIACARLQAALKNPAAVQRYSEHQNNIKLAWEYLRKRTYLNNNKR